MDLNSIQEVKPHLVLMKISKISDFYAAKIGSYEERNEI